jgi:hypothetical protein
VKCASLRCLISSRRGTFGVKRRGFELAWVRWHRVARARDGEFVCRWSGRSSFNRLDMEMPSNVLVRADPILDIIIVVYLKLRKWQGNITYGSIIPVLGIGSQRRIKIEVATVLMIPQTLKHIFQASSVELELEDRTRSDIKTQAESPKPQKVTSFDYKNLALQLSSINTKGVLGPVVRCSHSAIRLALWVEMQSHLESTLGTYRAGLRETRVRIAECPLFLLK